MDIEFIETEHRENVLKLMEICGIDMKEAYQLYTDCGFNFQASVNRKFNPIDNQANSYDPYSKEEVPYIPPEDDPVNPEPYIPGVAMDPFFEEDDIEMMEYRKFKQGGKKFDSKFPIKTNKGFFDSLLPKFIKGSEENPFKRDLDKYLGKRINIKTEHNFLSEALHWAWKEKFPLAVFILDFKQSSINIASKFFSDEHLIEKILSEQFKPFGLNSRQYELEPELKNFFDLNKDNNSVVICRVNHMDNIQIVKRIHISEPLEEIRKKVKQAKSSCIQNELDESHIAKQYVEELRGNFNYVRPKTIKENIKMRQDKKLRKQQEQEYFKACQPKQKEPEKPAPRPENSQKRQQIRYQAPLPNKIQPKQEIKHFQSESRIKQLRAQKLSRLRKYNSGIMFKIRVPEGRNLMIQVDPNERVQYLFDFVESQPEDIGFSNQLDRKFDICVGFGGGEKLRGQEGKLLRELFEGSEALIVKQL